MNSVKYLEQILTRRYEFELDRKDRIANAASLPITIFTLLSGAVIFYVRQPLRIEISLAAACFATFAGAFVLSMLFTIYYTIRVFVKYRYGYIVGPKDLKLYYDRLHQYFEASGVERVEEEVEKELRLLLVEEYTKYCELNIQSNRTRTAYLFRSRLAVFVGVILLVPCLFLYATIQRSQSQKDHYSAMQTVERTGDIEDAER